MDTIKTLETDKKESKEMEIVKTPFIPNKSYDTLSEALNDLKKRGFTYDYNFDTDCLFCLENNIRLNPEDFKIVEYYRFEGNGDPADSSIVYAINSDKYKVKGVLVNGYGIYTENATDELLAKFKMG